MVTPNRKAILEKARELWHEHEFRKGVEGYDIEPEEDELREGGWLSVAQSELMRDNNKAIIEEYFAEKEQLSVSDFRVDIDESMRTGVFITGTRQCGKTNLGKLVVTDLLSNGIIVYIIDPTQAWLDLALPIVTLEQPNKGMKKAYFREESTIIDSSRLSPYWQQSFIEQFNKTIMNSAIERGKARQPQTMIVYEEAHTPMPNHILNSKAFRETKRLITQGANFNISFMAITQFASMVDKLPVKAAQQRYFGKTSEPNDLKYLRAYLGERTSELPKLETGQFIYTHSGKTVKIQTELYRQNLSSNVAQNLVYTYICEQKCL